MLGRDLKAEAVRAGVPLYRVAAAAGMHPNRLSELLNERAQIDAANEQRIRAAIQQTAGQAGGAR
jgi:plasmid maintenance system antidote protein VapI